jgi:hypothetical protein
MRRKEDIPIKKVTINLYDGDMAILQEYYPRLGGSKAIRALVRKHVNELLNAAAEARGEAVKQLDLPIDLVEEALASAPVEAL